MKTMAFSLPQYDMDFPRTILINYKNKPIPVYVVGDIKYLYFVAKIPAEGEVHLNLDFEEDGQLKWIEVNGNRSERATEIGNNIIRQMEKAGYNLGTFKS
jgi:hypothetical protein